MFKRTCTDFSAFCYPCTLDTATPPIVTLFKNNSVLYRCKRTAIYCYHMGEQFGDGAVFVLFSFFSQHFCNKNCHVPKTSVPKTSSYMNIMAHQFIITSSEIISFVRSSKSGNFSNPSSITDFAACCESRRGTVWGRGCFCFIFLF